jgi:cytochrome P450
VAPGFQPLETYEAIIANLAPALERRSAPESAEDVLHWAGHPLTTAEVAAVLGVDVDEARSQLSATAIFEPAGSDGYWTP